MKKYLYFIPLLSMLLFASCSSEDDLTMDTPEEPGVPMIPFEATIGEGSEPNLVTMARADEKKDGPKKAISVDGNTIKPVWTVGEELGLIVNNEVHKVKVTSVTNNRANISGSLPNNVDGKTAKFIFPYSAIDLSTKKVNEGLLNNQDGTLETIAKDLDVREGNGVIKVSGGKAGLENDVDLSSSFCIMRIATTCYGKDYNITDMKITSTTSSNKINNDITLSLANPVHENIYVALRPTTGTAGEEFMFRTGDQSNTTLYVVRYANLTRAKGKYYRTNISLLWEFYKENCFAQWDATDFWENYTTGHNENNTLSLWGQATNDLCKDMPTAKEMLAYMTYGDVYSEQTTQWYLGKTIYSGGLWFLPKASIESNQGVSFSTLASALTLSLSENKENVIQEVVKIDVAHQARPSNPNNYFFIPFLGSYMYHGWYGQVNPVRRGQEIAIWTSTAAYLAEEVAGLDWNSAFNLVANPGEHEIQYGPYTGDVAVYLSLDHWLGERNMGFLCGVRPNNLPWFK